jgi:superfamily II DNA/RNA helicase
MNYTEFYTNAKRRTQEALLSMWAAGKKDTQEYLKKVFEEEPILAEPVFQSMFPWESDNRRFSEFTNIFDEEFIKALSGIEDHKFNFPKDRKPYTHQAESWKQLLNNKKSIVVTSGTGSGKTECFMLPIIQDLARQQQTEYGKDKDGGIQAIFLYPLNALMSSQQKRMSAWCKAVSPKVTFAMYKGDTIPNSKAAVDRDKFPELISRCKIRATPPQILFTNPTMLEYMLVRKQDKRILEISKQKKSLRWIVLDEAHTYSGSSAAELALQIRRVLDAFDVNIDDVRFAATSATLGSGEDDEYRTFLSQVTGKKPEDIVVIHGNQIIPDIEPAKLTSIVSELNRDFAGKFTLTNDKVLQLRNELKNDTLSAKEIASKFAIKEMISIEDSLLLIDKLSEKNDGLVSDIDRRGALLPTRAHFFVRNIGGLYACVNPECKKHKDIRIDLGALTTNAQTECRECGSKLIEINRCNSCGNLLLVGQEQDSYYGFAKRETQSLFEIENNDENNDENNNEEIETPLDDAVRFVLAKGVTEKPVSNSILIPKVLNTNEGKLQAGEKSDFVECFKKGTVVCPHCGERTDKLQSMYSGNLFSRLLAPTLLEQTVSETDDKEALWQGRKYISFTDNRQGTAKSTFQMNIEVERNWIRTAIYHYLANERRKTITPPQPLTEQEEKKLKALEIIDPNDDYYLQIKAKKEGNPNASNPHKSFTDFANAITENSELKKLYEHLPISFSTGRDTTDYLQQLMIDQFGRRPRKAGINNPETMGLVKIVYPPIENATMPHEINEIFNQLVWCEQDWKDFLKITLDYFFRENRHIDVPDGTKRFRTQAFVNSDVYPPNSNQTKKFPTLNLKKDETIKTPNRLVVLLLLAMGIKREEDISQQHETYINQILSATWNFLRINILNPNTDEERGYKLDLLGDKVAYQIIDKAWICTVNQVPLDTIFRGYSPLMTSRIASNLEKYKITEPQIEYPYFPYAYKNDVEDNRIGDSTVIDWIEKNMSQIQSKGLWSNLHERILLNNPVYLSAEHTAQQNKDALRKIETDFENHKLNVLSCSTTMEMGVDISGISEVVMTNVPPKPSNYLQRAGRAGRGSETKALSLTFCAPGPIGANLFSNQKWAMTHKTAVPKVSFDSNVLVQRHVNSFLLSSYIATDKQNDLTVSSSVEKFFFQKEEGQVNHSEKFAEYLNNIILGENAALCERFNKLVRGTCKQTSSFTDSVSICLSDLEKIKTDLVSRIKMLEDKIKQLREAQYNEESPATKAIESQLLHILRQNILGFFAEHNFIPSAGIPTGIVEFDKYNIADYRNRRNRQEENDNEGYEYQFGYQKANPSMLLTQAITEYAPGNQIVLNEACFVSRGIVMKSQWDNARRVTFQYCPQCGFAISKEGDILKKCPHCNNGDLRGLKNSALSYAPLIEPAGFRVDFSEGPTRTINNHNTKNYTQPELLNMPPWEEQDELSNAKLEIRYSTQNNGEILYYNLGNGNGYAVCLECGKAVPDIKEDGLTDALQKLHLYDHRPIIGGRAEDNQEHCSNNNIKRNVLLGGRFQTDFVEIRFRDDDRYLLNDEETVFSLGVILTQKLAEKLGINTQEINFGIKKYRNYSSIFIYDTVKGGAGYSIRFNELKEEVIDMSKTALENCKCDKACDKCLINRNSQWSIDKLNRQKALEWLKLEIHNRNQAPEHIKGMFAPKNVCSLTTNFSAEFNKISVNPNLFKIIFFIDNNIENWKPEVWEFYELANKLKKKGVDVCFAFQQPGNDLRKLSASQLSVLAELRMSFSLLTCNPMYRGIENLIIAEFTTEQTVFYFAETDTTSNKFDDTWAKGNSYLYKVAVESNNVKFTKWEPNFDFTKNDNSYIMFDFKITDKTTTRSLAEKITSFKTEKWNAIFSQISNSRVNISYTDVYLKSPLSCRILIDIVSWFVKKANLTIDKLNLYLAEVKMGRKDDFDDTDGRDEYLNNYAKHCKLAPNLIKSGKLPHYREMKFENSCFELIVRPDGGFENGWTVDYADKSSDWEGDYKKDVRLHNRVYVN